MNPSSNHDQSISVTFESIRDFNVKMIDMAQANTAAVFDFARQLSTAKSSSDLVELWTAHTKATRDSQGAYSARTEVR